MTNDELDAIEAGDALADPPPWTYDLDDIEYREKLYVRSSFADLANSPVTAKGRVICLWFLRQGEQRKRDIQNLYFLCNARLNVRTLCATIRNRNARIEELEAERDRIHADLIKVEKNYEFLRNQLGQDHP